MSSRRPGSLHAGTLIHSEMLSSFVWRRKLSIIRDTPRTCCAIVSCMDNCMLTTDGRETVELDIIMLCFGEKRNKSQWERYGMLACEREAA